MEDFLSGSECIKFEYQNLGGAYKWIKTILTRFKYKALSKNERGVVKRYIEKISGYSRAQITRLIRQYRLKESIERANYKRSQFSKKYTRKDIELLANTDKLHRLSGPAIKKILEKEEEYGHSEYENIAKISASHIYNLRKTNAYKVVNIHYSKTRPTSREIGERCKPEPKGKPGYIRVDTVHQGDFNGKKGVYHINAVDEITQWEIVLSVEKISEGYLIPALEEIISQFPFVILSFHSDNGSEYINRVVSKLLNRLLIKLTKSRPRKSNDNALAESKNASIVRKHMGYGHIPQRYASKINEFNRKYLNIYINFYRPCFFPELKEDKKGKVKKSYSSKNLMTPFQKLCTTPLFCSYLKKEIELLNLHIMANKYSPNQFMQKLLAVQTELWNSFEKVG